MAKRILTIDDLVQFCRKHRVYSFDAKEFGHQLCVQIPSEYALDDTQADEHTLFGTVRAFHTGKNRNGSSVTEEAALNAMKRLAYKPLLAHIVEVNGEKNFGSHDFEINDKGEVIYLERQIGCFTADEPKLMEDTDPKHQGRKYVVGRVAIPREYTDAADIIERRNGTKVSVELAINSYQYDKQEKVLLLTDVEILGLTCLGVHPDGTEVLEGMENSKLTIDDFSIEHNTMNYSTNQTLIEALERLNKTLSEFNIDELNSGRKGDASMPMPEDNALVQTMGEDTDNTDSTVEQPVETELNAQVVETSSEDGATATTDDTVSVPEETHMEENADTTEGSDEGTVIENDANVETNESTEGSEDTDAPVATNEADDTAPTEDEPAIESYSKVFELSHGDIRCELYRALVVLEVQNQTDYFITDVYDDYFMYESYDETTVYKQGYSVENDVVTLADTRETLHRILVTDAEKATLDAMRENYAVLEEKIAKYEQHFHEQEAQQKDALLGDACYQEIAETDEFKELCEHKAEYSVNDLEEKANAILGKHNKQTFAARQPHSAKRLYSVNDVKTTTKMAYGGLFKNDNK